MLIDGIFVMLKGKFIGSEQPGPWTILFHKLNFNVFKLGPLFITFGILWLIVVYAIYTAQSYAYMLSLIVSVCTLLYLPVGTLFSMVFIIMLITMRIKLAI